MLHLHALGLKKEERGGVVTVDGGRGRGDGKQISPCRLINLRQGNAVNI